MRAVVTGMIATYPVGGVVWDYGQYAVGLERLGFEVYYLEDTGCPTYDPIKQEYGDDPSFAVDFLARALGELSPTLGRRWHFRAADGRSHGLSEAEIAEVLDGADLFLNVSGSCLVRDACLKVRRRVLIDTDPGWNHFVNYPKWDQSPGWLGTHGWRAHDAFFTYAANIGRPGCDLPPLGIAWIPTRPPVLLDAWQARPPGEWWTTVLTWNNFRRPIEGNGRTYGTKELEFGRIETLPGRTTARLEIAAGGSGVPRERWQELGWRVIDSHRVSATTDAYRAYIEGSRGELSVAKNVYVATRSGWFSCRSVCYLAAGLPVVIQDTGFSDWLPVGEGVLAFTDLASAERALAAVEAGYDGHARAAAAIAGQHFAAERVLAELLDRAGVGGGD